MRYFQLLLPFLALQLIAFPTKTDSSQCKDGADLAFIVDSSGSMLPKEFATIKDVIKQITVKLTTRSTNFHVAVVLFSDYAHVEIGFNKSFDLVRFNKQIDAMPHLHNNMRIDLGLKVASDEVFTPAGGSRENVHKIAVVFIDGRQTQTPDALWLQDASRPLKQKGVRLFAIGIGSAYWYELWHLSRDVSLYDDFSDLILAVDELVDAICTAIDNPKVRIEKSSVSLFVGREETLYCYCSGWPFPSVTWLINGEEVKDGDLHQTINQEMYMKERRVEKEIKVGLRLSNVSSQDGGNYTCKVTNKFYTRTGHMTVSVSCAPPLLTVAALPAVAEFGNATLSCQVSNIPYERRKSLTLIWNFNRQEIAQSCKYKTFSSYSRVNECQQATFDMTLVITNTSSDNLGDYFCKVKESSVVTVEDMIRLTQLVTTRLPQSPTATISSLHVCGGAFKFEWKPQPSEPRGGPITGYEIRVISADGEWIGNRSFPSVVHSFVFSADLSQNTIYNVGVRAKNQEGFGPWSSLQYKTTSNEPDAVVALAHPSGCGADLTWSNPSNGSCKVLRYSVYYRKINTEKHKGDWHTKILNATTQYRLRLDCEESYEVMVIAWDEKGHSKINKNSVSQIRTQKGVPFGPLFKGRDTEGGQCGDLNVTWGPPEKDAYGGSVLGYLAQLKTVDDSSGWRNCTADNNTFFCLFHDLLSATEYYVRVQAVNVKGAGHWSSMSIKTSTTGPPRAPVILNYGTELPGRNVTVKWDQPSSKDCPVTMFSLYYKIVEPADVMGNLTMHNITNTSNAEYKVQLHFSKMYEVIVSAWNKKGETKSAAWRVRTAQDVPYALDSHQADATDCASITVSWSAPSGDTLGGPIISYLAQVKRSGSADRWLNCTTSSTSHSHCCSCFFSQLKQKTRYEVALRAKNKFGYSLPFPKTVKTGIADRPEKPSIKNTENEVPGCNITLHWDPPLSNGCPITFYTVHYRLKESTGSESEWIATNVSDAKFNEQYLELRCRTTYAFEVIAWNAKGPSEPSKVWYITTGGLGPEVQEPTSTAVSLKTVLVIAGVALAVIVLILLMRWHLKRKRNRLPRTRKEIKVLEHCEIPPLRTAFLDELGQGAFGKVYSAQLKDGLDYFRKDQERLKKSKPKTVAVKVLHENAVEEQRREFLDEIELMKCVGKHRNVLSFLGCWTISEPLQLVIEYVAHGDLLHWLRERRKQITGAANEPTGLGHELYAGTKRQIDNTGQVARIDDSNAAAVNMPTEGGHVTVQIVISDESIPLENASTSETDPNKETKNAEISNNCEDNSENKQSSEEVTSEGDYDKDGPSTVAEASNQEPGVVVVGEGTSLLFTALKKDNSQAETLNGDECDEDCSTFKPSDLLSFAWQISQGMAYLAEKGLVHRDLAARNVLVGHGKLLKVADFGLMREVYHEVYEVKKQKRLPVKWMAPESLYDQVFTTKSDVWSYGVILWEIATVGGSPYPLLGNAEIMSLLRTGYRMEKPDLCSDSFFSVMTDCWNQNPEERPSFQQLTERLETMMNQEFEYMDFGKLDESKDYYNVRETKSAMSDCG